MKLHTAVARALADSGVADLFGLMGDANMYVVADFLRDRQGRYYGSVTESGACSMAQGYARVSGRVGVATVTHGPAAANTINAVTEAARIHTPFVLITGTTPSKRNHIQHIDLQALFAPTGAEYHRVLRPEDAVDDIARVLARAAATRRPIVLDIPADLHFQEVEYSRPVQVPVPRRAGAQPESLDQALGHLASANRPLVLAGRGALEAGAREQLIRLADLLGAPLATTAGAKDLFAGHPYNLGIMGSTGFPWAVDVMTHSDCVIAFGAGLNHFTTYDGDILDGRTVIHCDIDPGSIGLHHTADHAVVGDAAAVARTMADQLQAAEVKPTSFRASRLGAGVLDRDPRRDFHDRSGSGFLDMRTAMITLDRMLPDHRIVVTDGGRFVPVPWRYLHVSDARDFVHTYGWGSIGLGTPTAIGAAVARPDALSVCVAGDGGGMMGIVEFSTAVRYELPFLMIVLNDAAYGAEYDKLRNAGFDPSACFTNWPEFADVARGLGGRGVTVRSEAELAEVLKTVDGLQDQFLIDVKSDPHVDYTAFTASDLAVTGPDAGRRSRSVAGQSQEEVSHVHE